jgi:hypothetical protein
MILALKSATIRLNVLTLFLGHGATLMAQTEQKITMKNLPKAVRAAFEKAYPNAKIKSLAKEVEKGKIYYEVESVDGEINRDLLYTREGETYEIEETIAAASLPQAVKDALQNQFKEYSITKAERTTHGSTLQFDVVLKSGKKMYEASIDTSGMIIQSKEMRERMGKEEKEDND